MIVNRCLNLGLATVLCHFTLCQCDILREGVGVFNNLSILQRQCDHDPTVQSGCLMKLMR